MITFQSGRLSAKQPNFNDKKRRAKTVLSGGLLPPIPRPLTITNSIKNVVSSFQYLGLLVVLGTRRSMRGRVLCVRTVVVVRSSSELSVRGRRPIWLSLNSLAGWLH